MKNLNISNAELLFNITMFSLDLEGVLISYRHIDLFYLLQEEVNLEEHYVFTFCRSISLHINSALEKNESLNSFLSIESEKGESRIVYLVLEPVYFELEKKSYNFYIQNFSKLLISMRELILNQTLLKNLGDLGFLTEIVNEFSHEINNPLAIIAGNLYQVKRHVSSEAILDKVLILEKVDRSMSAVNRISNKVKDLDIHPSEKAVDQIKEVTFAYFVYKVLNLHKDDFRKKSVTVSLGRMVSNFVKIREESLTQAISKIFEIVSADVNSNKDKKFVRISSTIKDKILFCQISLVSNSNVNVEQEIMDKINLKEEIEFKSIVETLREYDGQLFADDTARKSSFTFSLKMFD